MPGVARVIADNPAQMSLVTAGTIVVTKILANAMRPRGLAETLALMVAANALCAGGAAWLTGRGVLHWQVRDENGCLVPLLPDPGPAA